MALRVQLGVRDCVRLALRDCDGVVAWLALVDCDCVPDGVWLELAVSVAVGEPV